MNVAGASCPFKIWPLCALGVVVSLRLELVDGYHFCLYAKRSGRYSEINKKFSLTDRPDAGPRLILVVFYGTLLTCAVASGILMIYSSSKQAAASTTSLDYIVVAGRRQRLRLQTGIDTIATNLKP